MRSRRRHARTIALGVIAAIGMSGTGTAVGELLGIKTSALPVTSSTLTTTGAYQYDAGSGTGVFSLTNSFINIAKLPDPVGSLFTSTGGLESVRMDLQISLDANGEVVDSGPGNHLTMTGTMDTDGDGNPDLGPNLLSGRIKDFGFRAQTATDLFDMRFEVTGGDLAAAYYGSDDIGVKMTAESSSFPGDFGQSFTFFAKTFTAPVPPVCVSIETQVSSDGVDWRDADSESDALRIQVPGDAEYRLLVSNCGDTDLKNVVVSDDTLPGAPSYPIGNLPASNGPSNPFVVTKAQMPGLFVPNRCAEPGVLPNVAKVVGEADSEFTSESVSDMNEAYVSCFDIGDPQIEVVKEVRIPPETQWSDANAAGEAPTGTIGSDAEYRVTVRNLSTEYRVSNPVIVDTALGVNVTLTGTLGPNDGAPGGSDEVSLNANDVGFAALFVDGACNANTVGDNLNIVQVTGSPSPVDSNIPDDPNDSVSADDLAYRVCVEPRVELLKQVRRANTTDEWLDADDAAEGLSLPIGTGAEFRFLVTNTGSVELTNATVVDTDLGASATVAALPPGATVAIGSGYPGLSGALSYDCSAEGEFTNVARVSATDPISQSVVTSDDIAYVDCKTVDIRIVKEVRFQGETTWYDANDDLNLSDVPPAAIYPAVVEYRLTVTNVGMFPLAAVTVGDPTLLGSDTLNLGSMAAGAQVVVDRFSSIPNAADLLDMCETAGRFMNVVTVNALVDSTNRRVEDTDEALFVCKAPSNGSIGDFVWEDNNGNGVQDAGEPGVADVTVQLLDAAMQPIPGRSVVTGLDGRYSFDNLVAGSYFVLITLPDDYQLTQVNVGSDATDSDAIDQGNGTAKTGEIVLDQSENDPSNDAGVYRPASLGDYVWEDLNGDGVQDPDEPGVSGVTVTLLDQDMQPFDPSVSAVTGSGGGYLFENLTPGEYFVEFTAPDGCGFTAQSAGGDAGVDSNVSPDGGKSDLVGLLSGEVELTLDAGLVCDAALGNRVWKDLDADGLQDDGEPGVAAITVNLWTDDNGDGSPDTQIGTTLTNANGIYGFSGLNPTEIYIVEFVNDPAMNMPFTLQDQGAEGLDSDANPANGLTAPITLMSSELNNKIDAGLINEVAALGDRVWKDENRNGQQDTGEPGVPDITVNLWTDDDGNGTPDTQIATTTTDANGIYAFTGLDPAETYVVQFVNDPAMNMLFTVANVGNDASDSDADPTSGITGPIDLDAGETDNSIDAGLVNPQPATIGNFVWDDLDTDGVQDANEPGISGVTVQLKDETGTVVQNTTTDANGAYSFTVTPGTYSVVFVRPDDYGYTRPNVGSDASDSDANPEMDGMSETVSVGPGDANNTLDGGLVRVGALGNFVWKDLNFNGLQDAGEPGVAGITVNLWVDVNGNGSPDVQVGTRVSNVDGWYSFPEVDPTRTYIVEFVNDPAMKMPFTQQGQGSDNLDSDPDPATGLTDPIDLRSGETNNRIDAGVVNLTASLGDRVWDDRDADGVQELDENGVPGVVVQLLDQNMQPIVGKSTTTDILGNYGFDELSPGSYYVLFTLPDGYRVTLANNGDDTTDSDVVDQGNGTAKTGEIVLEPGENDPSNDAGLYLTATLGDFAWEDLNANGLQDANEPQYSGVKATLLDGNMQPFDPSIMTTTDDNGIYLFQGLTPGLYFVQFEAPVGCQFTQRIGSDDGFARIDSNVDPINGKSDLIELSSGEIDLDVDVGLVCDASIGDRVWKDLNENGQQDAGEPGIEGVTVNLWTAQANGTPIAKVDSVVTVGDGIYNFRVTPDVIYVVEFAVDPAMNMPFTTQNQGDDASDSDADPVSGLSGPVSVAAGANDSTIDAGVIQSAPSIDIRKQEEGPDSRTFTVGDDLEFEIAVTNTGNIPLNGVQVSDPLLPDCDDIIGALAAGQSVTYSCGTVLGGGRVMKTFKDQFSSYSYDRNDGSDDFTGPWVENDKDDHNTQSPFAGNVKIGSNFKVWLDDYPHTGTDPSIQRTANLDGLNNASLEFDWETHSGVDKSDKVVVEISSNGGGSWTILDSFTGFSGVRSDHEYYDISPYISSQTTVRFRVAAYYGGQGETFKVDNVRISGSGNDNPDGFVNEACVSGSANGQDVSDCDTSEVIIDQPTSTCVECSDGLSAMTLKIISGSSSRPSNERVRVREDNLHGAVLFDSYNDGDPNSSIATGGSFSFTIPHPGRQVVVTVQGSNHPNEYVKATFDTDCSVGVGDTDGSSYVMFKVVEISGESNLPFCPTGQTTDQCVEIKNYDFGYLKGKSDNGVWMTDHRGDDTKWILEDAGASTHRIRSALYDKTIDGDNASGKVSLDATPEDDDRWIFESLGGDKYYFKNFVSGRYLDGDRDYSVDTGSADGSDNKWLVTHLSGSACNL